MSRKKPTPRFRGPSLVLLCLVVVACSLLTRSTEPITLDIAVKATAIPVQTVPPATASPSMAPTAAPTPSPTPFATTFQPSVPSVIFADVTTAPTAQQATATTAPATATPAPTASPAATATISPQELLSSVATPTPIPGPTPTYEYKTNTLQVEITRHDLKNVVYFAVDVKVSHASQLRSAFSSDRFDGATEPVSDIAARNGAVVAVNGDFATFNNGGIIIRNGDVYRTNRSTRQLLVVDRNGDFIPYVDPPDNAEEAAATFHADGVWQTMVFGPVLVADGRAVELPSKFFINTGRTNEPRTAIAQLGPLHYLILVVDGRQDNYSQGVSLGRLQELFIEHGAITAFNLDGGGSTTLYFDGQILNRPANGGQRHVPDIVYFADF